MQATDVALQEYVKGSRMGEIFNEMANLTFKERPMDVEAFLLDHLQVPFKCHT